MVILHSMDTDIYLMEVKGSVIYLFYFVVSICITTYSIVMNVALIIEATERYFVYFITSK